MYCWFDQRSPSTSVLKQLQTLASSYKDQSNEIAFRIVSADPQDEFTNSQLRQHLRRHNIELLVSRDVNAVGLKTLGVEMAPTVLVLGKDHHLEFFEVGANPNIKQTVDLVLRSLLANQKIAVDMIATYQKDMKAFRKAISHVRLAAAEIQPESLSESSLPSATKPKRFTLTPKEQIRTLDSPRNLVVVGHPIQSLVALNGTNEIFQLDPNGKIQNQQSLPLERSDSVTQIHHFPAANGDYFLAYSIGGRQAFVFDQNFKVVLKYPTENLGHPGIQDALLHDLDGDKIPELYIAFADTVGLHHVDLNGKVHWRIRSIPGIQSLAIDRSEFGRLLVSNETGRLTPLFVNGNVSRPIQVGERTIHSIYSSNYSRSRPTVMLATSLIADGRQIGIGLDRKMQEQWSYGLPYGLYSSQVTKVSLAKLSAGNEVHWFFVGPDGSIHLVRDDGNFFDSFQTGEHILGVAAGFDGSPKLFVSFADRIATYEMRFEN